jgi:L-asparaginase/Glu-tRNA(Gln) amidotransferase subunit D
MCPEMWAEWKKYCLMMLDSSNMGMQERIRIVKDIQREYEDVDG